MPVYQSILNYYNEHKWTDLRSPPCGAPDARNVQRFRGGLVFKAHRLVYHPTLGLRVTKKKKKKKTTHQTPTPLVGTGGLNGPDVQNGFDGQNGVD